jgi:hypothetical protein
MISLIQAIKDLRNIQRISGEVDRQTVQWSLAPEFIGQPINDTTIHNLSQFVDHKLREYASIHGSFPAVNNPNRPDVGCGTANYVWRDRPLGTPGVWVDEQVCHGNNMDGFQRTRHQVIRIPDYQRQENIGDMSFITSYSVDYNDLTVSARVITASGEMEIPPDIWMELGGNPGSTEEEFTGNDLRSKIRSVIKSNLCIINKAGRSSPISFNVTGPERTALETLREMLPEEQFRQYLRYGFIIVRGSSGRQYQIFRDNRHTMVYKEGKIVEEICIRIKDNNIPPTDNVVAFKSIIEASEDIFRSSGNIYKKSA